MKKIIYLFIFLITLSWCSWKNINNNIPNKNLSWWKIKMTDKIINKAVSPEEFKKLINTWKYTVIDIRTPQELDYFGYIFWMNYHYDMYNTGDVQKILELPKDEKYLIYCYHGNRTAMMREYMIQNWFKYVIDLAGGTDLRVQQGDKLVH